MPELRQQEIQIKDTMHKAEKKIKPFARSLLQVCASDFHHFPFFSASFPHSLTIRFKAPHVAHRPSHSASQQPQEKPFGPGLRRPAQQSGDLAAGRPTPLYLT